MVCHTLGRIFPAMSRPSSSAGGVRGWLLVVVIFAGVAAPFARAAPPEIERVAFPYVLHDDHGNNWDVQYNGMIRNGANNLYRYNGGARLSVNGRGPNRFLPQGQFDSQRNEVTVGPWDMGNVRVMRKIAVDRRDGFCRIAEILENPTPQAVRTQVRVQFNMGMPIRQIAPIALDSDPRSPAAGYAIDDGTNVVAIIGGGAEAKLSPRFEARAGTSVFTIDYDFAIPPRETVVLLHVQSRGESVAHAARAAAVMNDAKYLDSLDPLLRKLVVNFSTSTKRIDGRPIFRGEDQDVMQLDDGAPLIGTIALDSYDLSTSFGDVKVPGTRVIAVLPGAAMHGQQLRVVLADGQVIAGRLSRPTIPITLASGGVFEVPLGAIDRIGYRRRPNEPADWNALTPVLRLDDGTRVFISLPSRPVELQTMYGLLQLPPDRIAAISFQPDSHGPHQVTLVDGSRLSGLLAPSSLQPHPSDPLFSQSSANVSAGNVLRMQFTPSPPHDDDSPSSDNLPAITMRNGDQLTGVIDGTLRLTNAFDAFDLNADEIISLTPLVDQPSQAQVNMWDGTQLTGELADARFQITLLCGVALDVPVALVESYDQPRPRPSSLMTERIEQLIAQLDARPWKEREAAQEQLTSIGVAAVSILKEHQRARSPESLQRISLVLQAIEAQEKLQAAR